jgi:hypothetical protein
VRVAKRGVSGGGGGRGQQHQTRKMSGESGTPRPAALGEGTR